MRSFKLFTFLILVICLTDFAMSMPMPAKTPKKAVPKKPAAKTTTVQKPGGAKKPATGSKKPATGTKTPATTKKPATAGKPATPANKPVNNATTKKPANSTADACPLPKKATTGKAITGSKLKAAANKPREWIESFVNLFRRDEFEFVGFHGTNGENGEIYIQASKKEQAIVVPFQFNGNDGELGGGLYVTDDFTTAQSFAGSSASNRINQAKKKGCPLKPTDEASKAVVCKVEAKSSSKFRSSATVPKMWIPFDEIATSIGGVNDPAKLAKQVQRITDAGMNAAKTLRFSVLNKDDPKNKKIGNQFMLPPGAFGDFIIRQCVPINAGKPGGTKEFPAFNYRNQDFDWDIKGDPFGDVDPNEEVDITDARKGRD